MNHKLYLITLLTLLALLVTTGGSTAQAREPGQTDETSAPLGTAITYQGRLIDGGMPANGAYDFQFILYTDPSGGSQVGNIVLKEDIPVSSGLFTLQLDFGPIVFGPDARWLEVGVRPGASTGAYSILSPRQPLTPAPTALYTSLAGNAPWSGLTGVPPGFADGIDNDLLASLSCSNGQIPKLSGGIWVCAPDDNTTYTPGAGLILNGTQFSTDTAYLQRRVGGTCATDSSIRVINPDGTVTCEPDSNTTYTAGPGLLLNGTAFSADTAYLQRQVSGTCLADSSIRVINPDGTVTCEPDSDTTYSAGTGLTLSAGQFSLVASYRLPQGCGLGQIPEWTGGAWVCGSKGSFWGLTGNAGTNPTTNYLGTSDNQPLELRVNGGRALRLEPSSGTPNLIGGYNANAVTAGVQGATIAGGGYYNGVSYPNLVTDNLGTIGGGLNNIAGNNAGAVDDAPDTTVAGGGNNTASGDTSTVGGGWSNTASGAYATIAGGSHNVASGEYSAIPGGSSNNATGENATVAGGANNAATGVGSFAAGQRAKSYANGAFVWADASSVDYDPLSYPDPGGVNNSFNVRATGGVYLVSAINAVTGRPTAGVWLSGSGWNTYSDPSFKQNITLVDSQAVLASLASVPISTWNYTSQDPTIRHIGPMAPDFNAAFGVGEPDKSGALKYINSLDADGVALAAIQGLYQRNLEQAARIQALEDKLSSHNPGGPSQAASGLPVGWLVLTGFLVFLVITQASMFFYIRRLRGRP